MSAITPLDLAWEAVNALGGVADQKNPADVAYNVAINNALAEIVKLGGSDPAARRHAEELAARDAELDRQNAGGKIIAIGDHDKEYAAVVESVRRELQGI